MAWVATLYQERFRKLSPLLFEQTTLEAKNGGVPNLEDLIINLLPRRYNLEDLEF